MTDSRLLSVDVQSYVNCKHEVETTTISNSRCSFIGVLDKLIVYLPMYTPILPSSKRRSKLLSIFVLIGTIMILLMIIITSIWTWFIFDFQEEQDSTSTEPGVGYRMGGGGDIPVRLDGVLDPVNMMYGAKEETIQGTKSDTIYNVYYTIAGNLYLLCLLITRLISMYYYYFQFNFPWYDKFNPSNHKWNKYKIFIVIISSFILILNLCWVIIGVIAIFPLTNIAKYFILFSIIPQSIFCNYPLYLTLIIQAIIHLKYYFLLSQLIILLQKNQSTSFEYLLDEYQSLYKSYKNVDCPKTLNYTIQIYLFLMLCASWLLLYELVNGENNLLEFYRLFALINIIIIFIVFITFSALLSETFIKFENLLQESGRNKMKNCNSLCLDNNYYNHLLYIMIKKPIIVKIGSVSITKINAVKFVVCYVFAKLVAQAMRQLY